MQRSNATIYAHRFDAPNHNATSIIGGNEPDVPACWKRSVDIAVGWEKALAEAVTTHTRKIALGASMIMSAAGELATTDNVFAVLPGLTKADLGGAIAGARQCVSRIHRDDFCARVTS